MLPYNPEDLWDVYRAEWERTWARLQFERLARQSHGVASDGVSTRLRSSRRNPLRRIRSGFRTWLPRLVSQSSAPPGCECCA